MLQKKIQHNVKIAEAKARHTESMMKRRKQILNVIVKKDRQMAEVYSESACFDSIRCLNIFKSTLDLTVLVDTKSTN